MKLENPGQNAVRTILAERDESSPTQNLTDIYVEYGTLYVAGSYCMGIADLHAALYEVKDGNTCRTVWRILIDKSEQIRYTASVIQLQ